MMCMYFSLYAYNIFPSRRALDFQKGLHRDLRTQELDTADWEAQGIPLCNHRNVKDKGTHAVDVHAIFRRLKDHISTILADLPDFAPLQLKIQRVLLSVRLG